MATDHEHAIRQILSTYLSSVAFAAPEAKDLHTDRAVQSLLTLTYAKPEQSIRVLRVLEYEYFDDIRRDGTVKTAAASMAEDLTRWGVPPNGASRHSSRQVIRSAIMLPQVTGDPPPE